ncbi:MAG: ParB N-terminal domain-containing protein [Paracoccaceae bacterium]|nr:MAG: ParB N-terminal domain-containing protein [Paracoccaceae bacterium]
MKFFEIPVDQIAADILPRDRSIPDAEAQADLVRSIETIGLRHPVEVFGIEPDEHHTLPWGLVSGYRRLMAFRALGRETIPAVTCNPEDLPAAMAAMLAENEVRAPVTPWEKGRFLEHLVHFGHYPDASAAIAVLYPSATRQQRARLRGFHAVVDALYYDFRTPERLSVSQMDRLATALRIDGREAIATTLAAVNGPSASLAMQWEALRPVLNAILTEGSEPSSSSLPGQRRPRHSLTLRQGMTLTRERTANGWIIRMTGPMAKSPGLVDDVFRLVEKWLQPEG